MHTQLLMHEVVTAIHREQQMAGAARTGRVILSNRSVMGGLTAGAQYWIGRALVRAGRSLQGGTAPRPEAVGS